MEGENSNPFSSILGTRAQSKKAFVILVVNKFFDRFRTVSFPAAIKGIEEDLQIEFTVEEKKALLIGIIIVIKSSSRLFFQMISQQVLKQEIKGKLKTKKIKIRGPKIKT